MEQKELKQIAKNYILNCLANAKNDFDTNIYYTEEEKIFILLHFEMYLNKIKKLLSTKKTLTFTENDKKILSEIIYNSDNLEKDFKQLLKNKDVIKIAKANDFEKAYKDFLKFESNFDNETKIVLTYEQFLTELNKGYGNSSYIQIARYFVLSSGIYYDNDYVD